MKKATQVIITNMAGGGRGLRAGETGNNKKKNSLKHPMSPPKNASFSIIGKTNIYILLYI